MPDALWMFGVMVFGFIAGCAVSLLFIYYVTRRG